MSLLKEQILNLSFIALGKEPVLEHVRINYYCFFLALVNGVPQLS
jgi:hypothetical protein